MRSVRQRRSRVTKDALEYLNPDELLEVTPKNLRLRKKLLPERERKRAKSKYA